MKHECPKCGKETEGTFSEVCEDCMQKEDELDAQEVYEQEVQNYMDYKFQDEVMEGD